MPQFALRYFQPPSSNSSVKTCRQQTNKRTNKQTNKQAASCYCRARGRHFRSSECCRGDVAVQQRLTASLRRCDVPVCLCVFVSVRTCVRACACVREGMCVCHFKFFELDRDVASLHEESPRLGLLHKALLNSLQHAETLVAAFPATRYNTRCSIRCNTLQHSLQHATRLLRASARSSAIRCNATCHARPPHASWQPRVTRTRY